MTKNGKTEKVDAEIDEIAQRILLELESASATNLSDIHYAKKILHLSDIHYAKKYCNRYKASHSKAAELKVRPRKEP